MLLDYFGYSYKQGYYMLKKIVKIMAVLFILLFSFMTIDYHISDGGFKRMYYLHNYNEKNIVVASHEGVAFEKEGYNCVLSLNSTYYTSHRILLIPCSDDIPVDFHYDGIFRVRIFSKNNLLCEFETDNIKTIFKADNRKNTIYDRYANEKRKNALGIYAFDLGRIPFETFKFNIRRLSNLEIIVDVVKKEERLKDYCEDAKIIIIPDLRL